MLWDGMHGRRFFEKIVLRCKNVLVCKLCLLGVVVSVYLSRVDVCRVLCL